MRPRTEIAPAQVAAIRRAMLEAPSKSAFQRLQCLWLRAKEGLDTEAIARTVGLSVSHVRRVWSDYLQDGLAGARGKPKGGRRRQNLTRPQETAVLDPLRAEAEAGRLVTVRSVQQRYEKRAGHAVPPSTVYRMLARHHWRRLQPRPKHPKDNPQARAAFKKTPGESGGRGGWAPQPPVAPDV